MDKLIVSDHLAQVERHVAMGAKTIERQRVLIRRLEERGIDTTFACDLLLQFEEMQLLHVADRERLLGELRR